MIRQSCQILSVFVLLALLLQALIPVGYMPSFGNDGKITMVICAGSTVKTVTIDTNNENGHTQDDDAGKTCPYAPVNTAANDLGSSVVLAAIDIAANNVLFADDTMRTDIRLVRQSPRAPPVLS